MSRTIKGKKGAGYEFWSRRPHSSFGFGPEYKRQCHRTERQQGKREAEQCE